VFPSRHKWSWSPMRISVITLHRGSDFSVDASIELLMSV